MNIPPEGAKYKEIGVYKTTGKKSSSDLSVVLLPSQTHAEGLGNVSVTTRKM